MVLHALIERFNMVEAGLEETVLVDVGVIVAIFEDQGVLIVEVAFDECEFIFQMHRNFIIYSIAELVNTLKNNKNHN